MKKIIFIILLFFPVNVVFSQEFYRLIELNDNRMYGSDIINLQTKLINLGFKEIGEIDGYYGPLTENAIKKIQCFLGFEQNGRINEYFWNFIFDQSNIEILEKISIVSKYNIDELNKESESRMCYSTEGGLIERFFLGNELKHIRLHFAGETFQLHYYLYYINQNYYFIVQEYYRYPFPIYYYWMDINGLDAIDLERYADEIEIIVKDEFWTRTVIEYSTYIKENNNFHQIKNGILFETDFSLERLIEEIEGKNPNFP